VEGEYSILWGTSSLFTEGTYTIVKQGTLPRGSTTANIAFDVPEVSYGNYFVQFFQATRDAVNDEFKVTPGITAIPSTAVIGSNISVKGTGFPVGDTVTVYFGNSTTNRQATTNSMGSFVVNMDVPEVASGNHTIRATSKKLTSENPTTSIQVVSNDNGISVINPLPDQNNSSSQNDNSKSSSSTGSSAVVTQQTQNVKPSKPSIISPKDDSIGLLGKQQVTFTWNTGGNAAGITYNLEIAGNFNFESSTGLIKKTGINTNYMTLNVTPGTYYWRVQAVDNKGNTSDWSYSPYPFKVGDFPVVPMIAGIIILICLVLIIRALTRMNRPHDDYYY